MTLRLLTRTISPYNGPDLFLGLFTDSGKALTAREAYIASVLQNDPWGAQSYRTVDLEADVRVVAVEDRRTAGDGSPIVFLASAYFEDFGQVTRRFLAVFSERQSALDFAAAQENLPSRVAPNRCEVDEVVVNIRR